MCENSSAAIRLELEGPFLSVEDWRRSQAKIPSRSEAVRLLLAQALGLKQKEAAVN